MNIKKTAGIALIGSFMLAGCAVHTTDNVDIDANKTVYDIDEKTGLCYSYIGARTGFSPDTQGLGVSVVPATPEVLEQIDPEKLQRMKANGIEPVNWLKKNSAKTATPKP